MGRWVITQAYGRCIEAVRRVDAAIKAQADAVLRGDTAERDALLQERAEWSRLMRETPKFQGGAGS